MPRVARSTQIGPPSWEASPAKEPGVEGEHELIRGQLAADGVDSPLWNVQFEGGYVRDPDQGGEFVEQGVLDLGVAAAGDGQSDRG